MYATLDDLVTALYVEIDDWLKAQDRRRCAGRPPRLTDAELACLAVAQVLLGCASERRWLRFARVRLGHLFPDLPAAAGYNKRLRAAGPLLARVIPALARRCPTWEDSARLLDSTPVPCAASRQTVRRSDLGGHAGYGYCAAHSRFFWGLRLYLLTTAEGLPVAWALADPKLGEREVVRDLLDQSRPLRPGQVLLADKGFAGREFEDAVAGHGAHLVRPDRRDEPARHGNLARVRQWIESVIDTLKGQLSLEEHGGRTPEGVYARVAQRLLALTAAIWHNWALGAPRKRSLIAYDH